MIKTRIFQIVGHIHNMQLCIEMISFINHENESILRWFSGLCEPRNFSRILCPVAGCIQTGWGSDLCLPAVVLWNSAPHVSTMLRSNLDLSDSVLDILQHCRCNLLTKTSKACHSPIINVCFLQRTSHFALADGTSFLMVFFVLKDKKYNLSNQYNFLQSVNNNQYK